MSKRVIRDRTPKDVGISQINKKSRTERGGRKSLDVLFEESAISLCKGYSLEQLRDLHEKIAVLASEVVHQLDYDSEVQEIIGAKLDGRVMWFCVKWETGEHSFIPSHVLNRIAPEKVIQYYESILHFEPKPEGEDKEEKGIERLNEQINDNGESMVDPSVTELEQNLAAKQQREQLRTPAPSNNNKPRNNEPPRTGGSGVQNHTMKCGGCRIMLQYPEGTKAIRCPMCNHVMAVPQVTAQ